MKRLVVEFFPIIRLKIDGFSPFTPLQYLRHGIRHCLSHLVLHGFYPRVFEYLEYDDMFVNAHNKNNEKYKITRYLSKNKKKLQKKSTNHGSLPVFSLFGHAQSRGLHVRGYVIIFLAF